MTQDERDRMRSILEYLHRHFGTESVQIFFTDAVSDNRWNFFSKLELNVVFIQGERFSYSAIEDQNILDIERYNRFLPTSFSHWRTDNNINYSAEKEEFIVILADDRIISIPIREMVIEHLNLDREMRNRREWIIRGDDYSFWVKGFNGTYYQANDSINMSWLQGHLFYK